MPLIQSTDKILRIRTRSTRRNHERREEDWWLVSGEQMYNPLFHLLNGFSVMVSKEINYPCPRFCPRLDSSTGKV